MNKIVEDTDVKKPSSAEELEAFLGVYELQNPAKFAVKVASGEIAKLRSQFSKKESKPEPKAEVKEKKAEEAKK